ncbi:MAG: carboxypeptidase-like regulatory domain-containing protein [Terriglobia bacterium]|jgi:hypothetical protein
MNTRNSEVYSLFFFLGAVMCLGILPSPVSAQVVKGTIEGSVVDSSGAAVPGAQIDALDPATSSSGHTVSDITGAFRIPLLAVGTYELTVNKEGFHKLNVEGVQVNSAATTKVGTLTLELGQVSTTVEVSGQSSMVEATQSQVTSTISNTMLSLLPTVGQNEGLDLLAVLLPGVNNTRDGTFTNTNGVGFSSNGLRGRNNDEQIDGANNNDNSIGGPSSFMGNTDWVQEYQLTTSNFGVEYSRNSGSVVNIITKSGTNNWHGDAFVTENSWKTATLTNTQIAFEGLTQVPKYNDEYSGISMGGPIKKDKIFVFAGFDNEIIPSTSVYTTGDLEPTPLGLQTLDACLPNSPTLQALNKYGPYAIAAGNPTPQASSLTTTTVPGVTCSNGSPLGLVQFAGVERTLPTPIHEYDALGRVDIQGAKDRVYGRYIRQSLNYINTNDGPGWAGYPVNVPGVTIQSGLDWTRTLSPTLVNEARVNFYRLVLQFGGNSIGNTIPTENELADALASVTLPPGYAGFGYSSILPDGRITNSYQFQDNLSWTHGRHTVKAGTNITYQRSPNIWLPNYNGTYSFETMADYFQDIPSSIGITQGNPDLDFREHDNFFYVGDDFKATRNLTLNLGLSYAYFGQPANLFNKQDTANETSSTPFFDPSLPLSVRVSPHLSAPKTNFGPSVGFAYAPHGGKTVIRGGYRLTYDPAYYNIYLNVATSAPQVLAQNLTGDVAADNPMPANPLGSVVRNQLASFLTTGNLDPRSFDEDAVPSNFRPDRVQGWSFGIQRQIGGHAVLESRYVGNHGGSLYQALNANPYVAGLATAFPNQVPSGITPCPMANAVVANAVGRENCQEGILYEVGNNAVSDYNGWQNELRTNSLWNQLTLRTSFTWSKTTDNTSEIFSTFAGNNSSWAAQNPFNTLHAEHALSGLDVPEQWTLSFVEMLPFFRGEHGLRGRVLGGWSFSGTYIISSGQAYSPIQYYLNYATGGTAYDTSFDLANVGTYETARPFVLSPSGPVNQVAIYGGDLCALSGVASVCNGAPNQLYSWNAFNAQQGAVQTVSANQARFLVNGAYADSVYGEPWGNAARNSLRDAIINQSNFQISKETNVTERVRVQYWTAFQNVFNHPNFASVDPLIEDAGDTSEGVGFATPSLFGGGNRVIKFGLKLFF